MATTMDGLFGPSPYEIEQQRMVQRQAAAQAYAQQSPLERAAAGMYNAGGMLGGMGAQAMGMVDPAVANAQRTEQIMGQGDADLSSSAGMYAKAKQFMEGGDRVTATKLLLKANEMKKQEAAAALAQQKQNESATLATRREDRLDRELKEVKIAGVTNKMQTEKDRLAANIARWSADANNDSLSIEQRREAANSINKTKLEIERMGNEASLAGITLKESYGANSSGRIDFSRMKDGDKWKIIKEQGADKAAIGSASAQTSDVVSLAKSLLSHPGLPSITGWDSLTNFAAMPSGDAKGALTLLESLKSKAATVGRALASESGKLGNMAMGEWKIVADDITNLDPSSKEFEGQVLRIVKKTEEMESRLRQNYDETYSIYEGLSPALSSSTLPPQAPRLDGTSNPASPVRPPAPTNGFGGVSNPSQVKQLFQSGKITRDQAKAILADMDSRGVK
jgi:hypothetical protein